VKVSDKFSFLKNADVATFLTMFCLLGISSIFAEHAFLDKMLAGKPYLVWLLEKSATFAGGLYIAKKGVVMFTEEIVPAFKGFSQIVAPGSIPAVDPMVLFDKSPNAVLIGFLVSFMAELCCVALFPFIGLPVIIPASWRVLLPAVVLLFLVMRPVACGGIDRQFRKRSAAVHSACISTAVVQPPGC
jgi:PTS system ascorbate-specific IIC component